MTKAAIKAILTLATLGILLGGYTVADNTELQRVAVKATPQIEHEDEAEALTVLPSDSKEAPAEPQPEITQPISTPTPAQTQAQPKSDVTATPTATSAQPTNMPESTPAATPKPQNTPKPVAETTLTVSTSTEAPSEPSETPAPTKAPAASEPPKQTEPTKPAETPQATETPEQPLVPTPTAMPEPTAQPSMEEMDSGFNNAVLDAINEARALSGNAPLSLDGSLCETALAHAKEMAKQGAIFHACGGVESVSDSTGSGKTIGTRSAVHASDLELNAGLRSLGVGSVTYNGKQYTCVIAN